jgi:hypothetical protein
MLLSVLIRNRAAACTVVGHDNIASLVRTTGPLGVLRSLLCPQR